MPKVHQLAFPVKDLHVTTDDLSIHIAGQKNALPPELEESARLILKPFLDLNVLVGYSFYPAKLVDGQLYTGGEVLTVGSLVSDMLAGVEQVAVFACTVEEALEQAMSEITDPVDIYLADVWGTIFIEKGIQKLKEQFEPVLSKYKTNQTTTFCPGNCGWEIEEQDKVFNLLPDSFLGIKLNDYSMMTPVKSLNGIVGFGEEIKYKKTSCKTCNSINCWYRKA